MTSEAPSPDFATFSPDPDLIDRRAIAAELSALAQRFEDESARWHEPGASAECLRAARQLRQLVATLDDLQLDPDVEIARAYAYAADRLLSELEGVRRFFTAVLSPLRRPGRRG